MVDATGRDRSLSSILGVPLWGMFLSKYSGAGRDMTQQELAAWINRLQTEDRLYRFYKSKEWIRLKDKVLQEFHNECLWCRERGKISRAETVHHIQFVKRHPELALSEYYTYQGRRYRNLVPLCHDCHDKAHERMGYKRCKQLNEERW